MKDRGATGAIALGVLAVAGGAIFVLTRTRLAGGSMRNDDLDCLHPDFEPAVRALLSRLRAEGYEPLVWETCRTQERQAELYSKGVSNAQTIADSPHGVGLAVDIIDGRAHPTRAGKVAGWGSWEASGYAEPGDLVADEMARAFFADLGALAELAGLEWGGRFTIRDGGEDFPHIQAASWRSVT